MRNIYVDLKIALKKNGDEWLDATVDSVMPINNVACSCVKQMTMTIGGTTIESNYHYLKSYITDLYSYDSQQKASFLEPAGWYVTVFLKLKV